MAKKPFREVKPAASAAKRAAASAASGGGIEDKVRFDSPLIKRLFDQIIDKTLHPKVEKDEGADKYVRDKAHKDTKDHKIEKLEKEVRETTDHFGSVLPDPQSDAHLLTRIAALEAEIGELRHFISSKQRPDLGKSALKDEPDAS